MIRTQNVAGVASVLLMACCAFGAAPSVQVWTEAQDAARMKAIKDLQTTVGALKVSETKVVKDFLESTDLPKGDFRSLLQGVVEYQPSVFYGDGECEVRIALDVDALRANLKSILDKHYKKEGGEFAKLTFESVGGAEKSLEAVGLSKVMLPPGDSRATVTDGIEGWKGVSARKRIAIEYAACQDALAKLKADAEKTPIKEKMTLADLMASNPLAKTTVETIFKNNMPAAKMYYPKGIVEVRFLLDFAKLWLALEAVGQKPEKPEQKIDPATVAALREATKGRVATASGFAAVDGKPVNPADLAPKAAPLELSAFGEKPAEPALSSAPATTPAKPGK